jgi:hypothetical protein
MDAVDRVGLEREEGRVEGQVELGEAFGELGVDQED